MMYIQEGDSALMEAVRRGKTGVVKELVKGGADLNMQNNVCCCVVHALCCVCPIGGVCGELASCKRLLNHPSSQGWVS